MGVRRAARILFLLGAPLLATVWAGTAFPFPGGTPPPGRSMSGEVFGYVERLYVEPDRIDPREMLAGSLQSLETHYPELLFSFDEAENAVTAKAGSDERTFELPEGVSITDYSDLLDEIVDFSSGGLAGEGDTVKMRYRALNGSLQRLDPHTRVMEPAKAGDWLVQTRGSFGGVGFVMSSVDDVIVVREVLQGTPAERIGLETGDRITAVDGTPTAGLSVAETVDIIRGDPGSDVVLTIRRDEWDRPRDLTARREVIRLSTVRHSLVEESGEKVLHISLSRFQKESSRQLLEALDVADREEVAGIILDLRYNPGGLLDQAVKIADLFLDDGTIVATRDRTGKVNTTSADPFGLMRQQRPLVVLINGSSASASEIVSAALQADRAVILGERSYGKGSVQRSFPLSGGGALNLTVAHYLTPGNVSIQSAGIVPDIVLSPVRVDGKLSIAPREHHGREEHLPNAFTSSGGTTPAGERPVVEYYRDGDSGTAVGRGGTFAVRLAARLIAAAGADASRDGVLRNAPAVLEAVAAEEQEKIRTAFGRQGINWSPAAESGSLDALHVALPDGLVLEAGETGTFTVRVENRGTEALGQVWGRLSSENRAIDGADFAVGALKPGEQRTVELSVDVPAAADDRWDEIDIDMFASGAKRQNAGQGLVRTVSAPRPDLVYSYTIEDENGADPSHEGNGVLEEGERGVLRLSVHNRGQGDSGNIKVQAGNAAKDLISLEQKTIRFDNLPPGSSREGVFAFLVRKGTGTAPLSLQFLAGERELLASDTIDVAVMEPYRETGTRHPPRIDLEPYPGLTGEDSLRLTISARDDGRVKDLYVYRGEKKISYLRSTGEDATFPATVEVPLSEGMNRIVIFARDGDNVLGRRTIHVLRHGPPA